ncbi:MAG: hypothetical protein ACR2O3_16350 [Rhizobiaceae bacterium]
MFILLKILHLLALVFGGAASLGNIYLLLSAGPHDLAAPGFTNQLRKLYRLTALVAIGVFWLTGVLMVLVPPGFWVSSIAFNAKIMLVILLSISVLFINFMAPRWGRTGGPPAYLKFLHWMNAALMLLAVVFAVAAFG